MTPLEPLATRHAPWCGSQKDTPSHPTCPACAYKAGWEAGVDAIVESGALDLCSSSEGRARETMAKVNAVREWLK